MGALLEGLQPYHVAPHRLTDFIRMLEGAHNGAVSFNMVNHFRKYMSLFVGQMTHHHEFQAHQAHLHHHKNPEDRIKARSSSPHFLPRKIILYLFLP